MKWAAAIAVILLASFNALQASGTFTLESGESKPRLIELYTSQGCSSCPPAERWFGRFTEDPELWKTVVPVVFHVDYWDRLGWKDRFASRAYTLRQYALRETGAIGSVYTPGFVVDGREWRGWFKGDPVSRQKNLASQGKLRLSFDAGVAEARYSLKRKGAELHVAVLGMGLRTDVGAGENRGRALRHEFVVLEHNRIPIESGEAAFRAPVIRRSGFAGDRLAVAAWIVAPGSTTPLVVMGNWLPFDTLGPE